MKYNPIGYEWHNIETGHCYVDYIAHVGQDEKDGYTKIPLYKVEQPQPEKESQSFQLSDEEIEKLSFEYVAEMSFAELATMSARSAYKQGAFDIRDQVQINLREELIKFAKYYDEPNEDYADLNYTQIVDEYLK